MNKSWYSILAILILSFAYSISFAQQNDLPSEQIEVIKDFEANLAKAKKFNLALPASSPDTVQLAYDYTVSTDIPLIEYAEPVIRPTAYRNPPPVLTHRGYFRGGYGLKQSILGDLSYHLVDRDNLNILLFGHHESVNNKDVPLMSYMNNDAGITGAYTISPSLQATGDLRYSFDEYNYYADVQENPSNNEDGRRYKTFEARFGVQNPEINTSRINYVLNVGYISHKDDLGVSEDHFLAELRAVKAFGDQHRIGVEGEVDMSTLKDLETRKLNNYFATPYYMLQADKFRVKTGARFGFAPDKTHIYPVVDAAYKLIDNKLIILAGANGSLRKNSFYALSEYNPYIHDQISSIRNTSYTSFYGGAKGRVWMIEYEGRVSYDLVDDLTLYLPDEDDMRKFQPLYDNGSVFKVEGEITSEPVEKLELGISAARMFYSLDNELKAWHLPELEGRFFAIYTLLDGKLRLRADMFLQSGIWYIREDGFGDTLTPLFDISLGADWFFVDNVGVFIQLNNITANNRERWYRYPTIGFQPMGGIVARF